jgi:hypothetical protein
MCREGRLYDVERWIAGGKAASARARGDTRPKTALQIALETGQHSLALLLLKSGYRLELERHAPLDLALESRRWDLFDMLLEWGGDLKSVDVYPLLDTYKVALYERFLGGPLPMPAKLDGTVSTLLSTLHKWWGLIYWQLRAICRTATVP